MGQRQAQEGRGRHLQKYLQSTDCVNVGRSGLQSHNDLFEMRVRFG